MNFLPWLSFLFVLAFSSLGHAESAISNEKIEVLGEIPAEQAQRNYHNNLAYISALKDSQGTGYVSWSSENDQIELKIFTQNGSTVRKRLMVKPYDYYRLCVTQSGIVVATFLYYPDEYVDIHVYPLEPQMIDSTEQEHVLPMLYQGRIDLKKRITFDYNTFRADDIMVDPADRNRLWVFGGYRYLYFDSFKFFLGGGHRDSYGKRCAWTVISGQESEYFSFVDSNSQFDVVHHWRGTEHPIRTLSLLNQSSPSIMLGIRNRGYHKTGNILDCASQLWLFHYNNGWQSENVSLDTTSPPEGKKQYNIGATFPVDEGLGFIWTEQDGMLFFSDYHKGLWGGNILIDVEVSPLNVAAGCQVNSSSCFVTWVNLRRVSSQEKENVFLSYCFLKGQNVTQIQRVKLPSHTVENMVVLPMKDVIYIILSEGGGGYRPGIIRQYKVSIE